jgi:plasmid stability protein
MSAITIRRLDEGVKKRLRTRAASNGRSMEAEAREILKSALIETPPPTKNLADLIRARFAPLGGVKLRIPKRQPMRDPPDFSRFPQ